MAGGGSGQDILGQKARAAQRALEARGMSPAKALRRALSRSADLLWGLAVVSQGVQIEMLDQDGVIETIEPGMLLVLLDGPDGALGLAAMDREVLTAIIEVQTIQQVTTIAAEDRPLTATDAAMVAPLMDATLARFADNLADHPLKPQLEGFRFGAMIEDSRTASLLLDAAGYRSFEIRLDIALGRRKGIVRLILPERTATDHANRDTSDAATQGKYNETFSSVPVRLDTVMTKVTMSLAQAQKLRVGDLINLPGDVTETLTLVAGKGQVVARGKLGQLNGMRAIRLDGPHGRAAGAGAARHAGSASQAGPMDAMAVSGHTAEPPITDAETSEPQTETSLPDLPALNAQADEDALPDLPPLDPDGMGDFDFSAASMGIEDAGESDGAVPMDFDFNS
ncbi:FliM/FliN family flagellar motor switch protein [Cognatishimia sp. F0-27]|uniref:FliM/FliN family flagellar motor switch protein n=1 Tax=Cognatishimia sp. F0-27 TaxID=2816855 RepID=UPI001D0C8110|nr:flagellar motor switch protein FliM [Cognatishimia sp. F0-27]MCC1491777.1 FliM/FliN family flagellar motor switch protein [Cognatishimia sp. F0-27]